MASSLLLQATARPESPAGPAAARGDSDQDFADIRAALDGDGLGYERLVRRHQSAVAAWLWRFTRDRAELDELSQQVFVEAWQGLRSYRGGSEFRTWLLAIATRVGYRFWRRRGREAGLPVELPRAEPESPSEAAEALFRLLERLAPAERLVLTLMYFEEQSVVEIAAVTGWSQALVKVRAFRARRRLRGLLEREGFGGNHE